MILGRHIGLDLDNTLADYRQVFATLAREWDLLPPTDPRLDDKETLRDAIRALPEGEDIWQAMQAHAYGPGMSTARLYIGVDQFIATATALGYSFSIISHRSEFARADKSQRHSLHDSARSWLNQQGLVAPRGPIPADRIHLEVSREAKLARIGAVAPELFVDDLPEVLNHPAFPATTQGWRFAPRDGNDWPALTIRLQTLRHGNA